MNLQSHRDIYAMARLGPRCWRVIEIPNSLEMCKLDSLAKISKGEQSQNSAQKCQQITTV